MLAQNADDRHVIGIEQKFRKRAVRGRRKRQNDRRESRKIDDRREPCAKCLEKEKAGTKTRGLSASKRKDLVGLASCETKRDARCEAADDGVCCAAQQGT